MATMYVIYKCCGYMDDYHQYAYAVTNDEEKAKTFVEKYNTKLDRIKKRIDELFPVDEDGMRTSLYDEEVNHAYMYFQVLDQNHAFYRKIEELR